MGKKSKANRNKTTVATSAATATATATATVTTTTIPGFGVLRSGAELLGPFPESTFYTKAQSFVKKGNQSKAKKILLQGIESGCVPCMDSYRIQILFEGITENSRIARKYWKDNTRLHLVLPLSLEGAIRGSTEAIGTIITVYSQLSPGVNEVKAIYEYQPAMPVINYWMTYFRKNEDRESRAVGRQVCKQMKESSGEWCCVCHKKDSDAITLRKCEGCKYYYYCSTDCQSNHWRAGHAGACRQLGLLKKYHRPFAEKIRNDIVVQGITPIAIPELQELRHRLGLSRPQADYQELLDGAQSLCLDSVQLVLPRNDGTVQIGSFPRPI